MLKRLRGWVNFRTTAVPPKTLHEAQHAAQEQREARASLIIDLQVQVRRLQQDITDLAAIPETGLGSKGSQSDRDELAELEHQLDEKQQELARYQGRI